jgi:asparagine synthase (glutamine-hydrolysing)
MCGIVGCFGRLDQAPPDERLLWRMVNAISHRGPDAQEVHLEPGVGLGHARLSIIDLAGGRQPMANDDGSIWITFNGEMFNFVEVRDELERRGHRFRTTSDTEVILRLYEEKGPDCVADINGDFAFAIWDRRQRRLLIARDRMGVRPCYYTVVGDTLYFASEVKALLQVPGVEAELDPIALDQIFTFWFPLAPRTPFKNISELPPGHLLLAEAGRVETRCYWRLDYPDAAEAASSRASEAAIKEELRALLTDATRIRLRSDVPVGAYLSGGLDSSLTTAIIKQIVPANLRTFSITFEDDEFDESHYQQQMVAALDTQHEARLCTSADIGAMFPGVIRAAERPILRTAPAPLYALAELVNERKIKVVMTGEGADEVFAGYDIFKEAKLRRFCARQPGSSFRPLLFRRLYPYLPGLQNQSQSYLEAFFKVGMGGTDDPLYSHLPRFRTTSGAKVFFSEETRRQIGDYDALAELRDSLPADYHRWHPLSQAQYLEAAHLLPGYILSSQGDRVAMAHAVEARFPFLDHRVVEFAARIPPELKIRGLREKHILREAFRDLLPAVIGDRPKQPYRAPDNQSFVGPKAPAYVAEQLSLAAIDASGYFNSQAVGKLYAKCASQNQIGFRDNQGFVGVLSTQLWHQQFVRREPLPADAGLPATGSGRVVPIVR